MKDDRTPPDFDDDSLPARLRDDLLRLSPAVDVPRSLDSAILSRAKAEYARRIRFRLVYRWAAVAAAMAACIGIVVTVRVALVSSRSPVANVQPHTSEVASSPVPGDINGDGKVDMLDAYILARRIAAGAARQPGWDVNGDGKVDQQDVDWIANASVRVDPGTRSRKGALR
jgi:hypothetical protein